MRTVSRLVVCLFSVALVFPASACTVTKFYPLEWNAAQVAGTLEALFQELLFVFDSGTRMLKATGCDKQIKLLDPLIATANKGDAERWQTEVEKRLWNAASQIGLFHHNVYGFDLKKPTGNWKTVSVRPGGIWAARLGGKAIYGLTLSQNKAQLLFEVLDLNEVKTAKQVGEPDSKLPLALWPQAISDSKWVGALATEYQGRIGGHAKEKTAYRSRAVWSTGTEKIVCERFYLAQPSASGASIRLYFFLITMPQADFVSSGKSLEDFVGNFSMPEAPVQTVIAKAPDSLQAAEKKAAGSSNEVTLHRSASNKGRTYVWRLGKNPSTEVQEALSCYWSGHPKEAETLWSKVLPKLSKEEHAEGLWYLAKTQTQQGKYREALPTLMQMEKEIGDSQMAFDAAMEEGKLLGGSLGNWTQAEIAWQRASKLAQQNVEKWEAACHLATVPFYKKQYRQALETLEGLLKQYPTVETADFVRWYLWYMKNCLEKKI